MPQDLAEQFEALWESGNSPPDLFAFLEQHNGLDATDKLAVLLQDQQHRWKSDKPLKVEDYLARLPELTSNPDCKLQLAVGEFQARQNGGTSPNVDGFTSRFSDISEELRSKLSELASGTSSGDAADTGGKQSADDPAVEATLTFHSQLTVNDERIGRYRLLRILGEGAFGRVWLGQDEELQRYVAIKVPTPERLRSSEDAETYLSEARTLASLDHPHIVPVHDVGRADDGSVYIVSKFIEGGDLAQCIEEARPAHAESAALIATIAEALQHAHNKRLIHRDIKPANILIEESTQHPYLADFGLAIREENFAKERGKAGSPAYMSPEQARGEGHRLDGRSDIFSLGAVFYELLTGKRPFRGSTINELLHQVVSVDPPQPRELDDKIPVELERICLKALSKRASDRYSTATELANDLLHWQQGPEQETKTLKIVPKGLRSFDADDAEFFLDLLPGPRNRDGLPESIQFWKTRIEETDPDNTFSVGLIYGPSGCGKSSLMKAGLLPRLADDVIAVYVEATPDETEVRILRGLRKQLPEISDGLGLVETLTLLRRGEGRKVVIVLDQFEQWLHAHRAEQETELVTALRQCDGGTLQAVVMVRDDFAMAAARFMDSLDIPILQGHNFATVDLFDVDHAHAVLTKFGQAFGKLPAQTAGLSGEEREFVTTVASGLAQDGKVVSVRLALFAEMVKGKSWVPATLEEVGGTEGIGVNFLEETFSSRAANPKHRLHQQAAREVLKALLPEVGSDIKGHMRSHAELLESSGYQNRPSDFNDLLRILDGELRLITPTDPEGVQTESGSDPGSKFYQLTHDFLVPSLHKWLTRKQKETRKGRAELKLEERAALWKAKPEIRHLPSLMEWANIRTLTDKKRWTEPQRKLMGKAGRVHGIRSSIALVIVIVASVVGVTIQSSILEDRAVVQAHNVEEQNLTRSEGLVESLLKADTAQVPAIIDDMNTYRKWVNPKLTEAFDKSDENSQERLHASLALLPVDPTRVGYLRVRLLAANPEDIDVIRLALSDHKQRLLDDLWRIVEQPSKDEETQFLQAASALALYDSGNERWKPVAEKVVKTVVSEEPFRVPHWTKLLLPIRRHLLVSLGDVFRNRDDDFSQTQIDLATAVLEQYVADDVETLAELILDAQPKQFVALFDEFEAHRGNALEKLNQELNRTLSFHWQDEPLNTEWTKPDPSIVQRIEGANGLVFERFAFCQTMPLAEFTQVAEELRKSGYRPLRLRPYAHKDSVHVAAAWSRDGRDWRMANGLSAAEIQQQGETHRGDEFVAVDVAGYVGESAGKPAEFYSALWMKKRDDIDDARIYAGATYADHTTVYGLLQKEGYEFQQSLQGFRGLDVQQKYSGVRTKAVENGNWWWRLTVAEYDGKKYFDKIHWDIDPSNAPDTQTTEERNEKALADAETKLKEKPDDVNAHYYRGRAYFRLGRDKQAVEDFDFFIEKAGSYFDCYQYRAILHARMGNAEAAKQDLVKYTELSKSVSVKVFLDGVVAVYLGEDADGMKRLESFIATNRDDIDSLYDAARAYSVASGVFKETDADKSKVYADRAISLITQAISNGYSNYLQMQADADLDPIRQQKGFIEIMQAGKLDLRYAAVWNPSSEFESLESHGLSPAKHLIKCRQMQAEGYRIKSISSASINGELVTASVWHRPLIPDEGKEQLAKRQANVAVALLRMGQAENVWPLLKHSPDPRVRSYIIHWLSPLGGDPKEIIARYKQETDVTIKRALLLCLGEFNKSRLPESQRKPLIETLLTVYRSDSDAGLHAAAEWLLRKWDQGEQIAALDKDLRQNKEQLVAEKDNQRQWYVNGQGQTFVILDAGEFQMGSPHSGAGHQPDERLHRRKIDRRFAISTKEVTRAQWRVFYKATKVWAADQAQLKTYISTDDSPMLAMTWYEAAWYCNWLSEQERTSEDQWCYEMNEQKEYGPGMKAKHDFLKLTGYRLPTEAEWEFACRAGANTSRYYGQTETLLPNYARYAANGDSHVWPVASLKPNDFGLFGMQGNAFEWCYGAYEVYPSASKESAADAPKTDAVSETDSRLLRGGSFTHRLLDVRSADRFGGLLSSRGRSVGFRPSRTYNSSP